MEDSSTVGLLILQLGDSLIQYFREHTLLYYCDFEREKGNSKFEETLTIYLVDILPLLDDLLNSAIW